MRLSCLVTVLAVCACNRGANDGPFPQLALDAHLDVPGLTAAVHVARDRHGIAHVFAKTHEDATFVQGYVMAHDRLAQLDLLRRIATGTLAELYGELDPSVIDSDLEMRMYRNVLFATQTWGALKTSTAPEDEAITRWLERFSDGINAYAFDVQRQLWSIDPELAAGADPLFDSGRLAPWTPVDSLAIARFHAFAMSWTAPHELELTDLYQRLIARFTGASAGITRDLMTLVPIGRFSPLDNFPNLPDDSGSRPDVIGPSRPEVPFEVLARARTALARAPHSALLGIPGPHAFLQPYAGSNSFAIGPALTDGIESFLAVDHQLVLSNPSVYYPMHIHVTPEDPSERVLDVVGLMLPGVPGALVGSNGAIAWANTPSGHDVNDLYLETCTASACTGDGGEQRPLVTFSETIGVGVMGVISENRQVTYEVLPHHGVLLPEIVDGRIVPREPGPALSVKYTGAQPSFEIRTLWELARIRSVTEGFEAVARSSHGGAWMFLDPVGTLGWTSDPLLPARAAGATEWHASDRPGAAAPFFVLDGRGGHEWTGEMSRSHLPHVITGERSYLVTADADPVGATYDGDALNQLDAAGGVLYAGVRHDSGLREERIVNLIAAAPKPLDRDALERFQHDTFSSIAAKLAPALFVMLASLDESAPAADVASYLASLSVERKERLRKLRGLLADWRFETPTGLPAAVEDSSATVLFHTWMHYVARRTIGDELALAGYPLARLDTHQLLRILHAVLVRPETVTASPTTNQPLLCDRVETAAVESCTRVMLEAFEEAVLLLETRVDPDAREWRWGRQHHLTLRPLFRDPAGRFELPAPGETVEGGFPRAGDSSTIDRADTGWADRDFTQAVGVAHRFLATGRKDGHAIGVRLELTSGIVLDKRDPHYRDLLDRSYVPETPFDVPLTVDAIIAHGETRWLFE